VQCRPPSEGLAARKFPLQQSRSLVDPSASLIVSHWMMSSCQRLRCRPRLWLPAVHPWTNSFSGLSNFSVVVSVITHFQFISPGPSSLSTFRRTHSFVLCCVHKILRSLFQKHRWTFLFCCKESTLHVILLYCYWPDQCLQQSDFVVLETSLLLLIDDNDCITDRPIANLFLLSLVQLPPLVNIEPRYINDSPHVF